MVIITYFLFLTFNLFANSTLEDIEKLNLKLTYSEFDKYTKNPGIDGLPGHYLASIVPGLTLDPTNTCPIEEKKQDIRYEVILVMETASTTGYSTDKSIGSGFFADETLEELNELFSGVGIDSKEIDKKLKSFWQAKVREYKNSGMPIQVDDDYETWSDLNHQVGREMFVEGIVRAGAESKLSEVELAKKISSEVEKVYKTEEEKYNFLSALSERLYKNYNNSRNPFVNNEKNNPDNKKLPEGDLSLNDLLKASSENNEFSGGVCNDISEVLAVIGKEMFPDKDVLIVNSSSHFALMITDGKKNRVIDAQRQFEFNNHLYLNSDSPVHNLRISHLNDKNELEQIAIVDTQMGELLEDAFKTGKRLLKTSPDINSLVSTFNIHNPNKTGHHLSTSLGVGDLIDSRVAVVVAKYNYDTSVSNSYIGVGFSGQLPKGYTENRYGQFQFHLRLGTSGKLIHYVTPQSEFKVESGIRAEGMYGGSKTIGTIEAPIYSGSIDWFNNFNFLTGKNNPDGWLIRGGAELVSTIGVKNWGDIVGDLSSPDAGKMAQSIGNLTFHLNQINANASVKKEIHPSVQLGAKADYQGSNVGQAAGAETEISVKGPEGVEFLIFVGARTNKLPGYLTKHSVLVGPEGFYGGAGLKHIQGANAMGQVQGIGSEKPMLNFKLELPLGVPEEKVPSLDSR